MDKRKTITNLKSLKRLKNIKHKIIFCLGLMIFISLTHCVNAQKIIAINVMGNFPMTILNEGKLNSFIIIDTVSIFYYKKYILYKLADSRKFETNEKIKNTGSYFIFKEGEKYGYLYPSMTNTMDPKRTEVEPLLQSKAFKGAKLDIDRNGFDILTYKKGSELIEKCSVKDTELKKQMTQEQRESYPDSLYLYYSSALNEIPYSFSEKMDSVKKMKLYKFSILNNPKYSEQYKVNLPRKELSFAFEILPVNNQKKIIEFFENFIEYHREQ